MVRLSLVLILLSGLTGCATLIGPPATLRDIRFFEQGPREGPSRQYQTQFDASRARYIAVELKLEYPASDRVVELPMTCRYVNAEGQTVGEPRWTHRVEPTWTGSSTVGVLGWPKPGSWAPGTYHVDCRAEGRLIAKGAFEVVRQAASRPAPAPESQPPSRPAPTRESKAPSNRAPAPESQPPSRPAPARESKAPSNPAPAPESQPPSRPALARESKAPSNPAPAPESQPPSRPALARESKAPSNPAPAPESSNPTTPLPSSAPPAAGPTLPPSQPRLALVIGNTKYPDSPLRNPINDATEMATLLRQHDFDVTLQLNANQHTMERAIQDFTRHVPRGSVGLFYFSGHGVQVDGNNYLLPIDGVFHEPSDAKYRAVSADWVLERMDDAGMDMKILILDACRDNPFSRSGTRSLRRGLTMMNTPKGSLIAYATSPGQTALDGAGRHSPYTTQLLRQIPVPRRPMELMFKAVRDGVQRDTQGQQTPWEASSMTGEFYFAGQ